EGDGELQVLCAGKRVPGVLVHQSSAQQHTVADQMAGEPKRGSSGETHAVKEHEGHGAELDCGRSAVIDDQILSLNSIRSLFEVPGQALQQIPVCYRVAVDDDETVRRVFLPAPDLIDRPTKSLPFTSRLGCIPDQDGGAGQTGQLGGPV